MKADRERGDLLSPGLRARACFPRFRAEASGIGILFLIGFTLCYMTAVSWGGLQLCDARGARFGYAVQTMLAIIVLHESWFRLGRWNRPWAMICVGVLLVGQTKPNTTNNTGRWRHDPGDPDAGLFLCCATPAAELAMSLRGEARWVSRRASPADGVCCDLFGRRRGTVGCGWRLPLLAASFYSLLISVFVGAGERW